jgi:hypothetical protein
MRSRHFAFALFMLLLAASVVACGKKKVGGKCAEGETSCADPTSALYCLDGKLAAMSCRGTLGCTGAPGDITCDNNAALESDGCDKEKDLACTVDKKNELRCRSNKFAIASTCRGPKGCAFEGNTLHCDTDVAEANDVCEDEDDAACSVDKKSLLTCKTGKYIVENTCKGPKGCSVTGTEVHCDDDLADLNDICVKEGDYACSLDKKALLVCKSNKFAFEKKKCAGKGCSFTQHGESTDFECN